MNTACAVYQHCLWREPRALAYVRDRGQPDWVIRQCAIGYADGHTIEAYLRRRTGLRIAQELGLLHRPTHADATRLRDHLGGGIVVPEPRGGHCIWFIGRDPDDHHGGVPGRGRVRLLHRRRLAPPRLQPVRHGTPGRAPGLPRPHRGGVGRPRPRPASRGAGRLGPPARGRAPGGTTRRRAPSMALALR